MTQPIKDGSPNSLDDVTQTPWDVNAAGDGRFNRLKQKESQNSPYYDTNFFLGLIDQRASQRITNHSEMLMAAREGGKENLTTYEHEIELEQTNRELVRQMAEMIETNIRSNLASKIIVGNPSATVTIDMIHTISRHIKPRELIKVMQVVFAIRKALKTENLTLTNSGRENMHDIWIEAQGGLVIDLESWSRNLSLD